MNYHPHELSYQQLFKVVSDSDRKLELQTKKDDAMRQIHQKCVRDEALLSKLYWQNMHQNPYSGSPFAYSPANCTPSMFHQPLSVVLPHQPLLHQHNITRNGLTLQTQIQSNNINPIAQQQIQSISQAFGVSPASLTQQQRQCLSQAIGGQQSPSITQIQSVDGQQSPSTTQIQEISHVFGVSPASLSATQIQAISRACGASPASLPSTSNTSNSDIITKLIKDNSETLKLVVNHLNLTPNNKQEEEKKQKEDQNDEDQNDANSQNTIAYETVKEIQSQHTLKPGEVTKLIQWIQQDPIKRSVQIISQSSKGTTTFLALLRNNNIISKKKNSSSSPTIPDRYKFKTLSQDQS